MIIAIFADYAHRGGFVCYGSPLISVWVVVCVCGRVGSGGDFIVAWGRLANFTLYYDDFIFDLCDVFFDREVAKSAGKKGRLRFLKFLIQRVMVFRYAFLPYKSIKNPAIVVFAYKI